jgi:hypothetical protein
MSLSGQRGSCDQFFFFFFRVGSCDCEHLSRGKYNVCVSAMHCSLASLYMQPPGAKYIEASLSPQLHS